jgi:hypothetical protein
VVSVFPKFDHSRRHTCHHRFFRNIAIDDGAGSDYRSPSDYDSI